MQRHWRHGYCDALMGRPSNTLSLRWYERCHYVRGYLTGQAKGWKLGILREML